MNSRPPRPDAAAERRAAGNGQADAVGLEAWHRRSLFVVIAALAGSGVLWLLFHYFVTTVTPWGQGPHPLEVWWLRLHGLAAMLTLVALGTLLLTHIRRAWLVSRNRLSGATLAAILAVLVATGYALYYFGGERTRPVISLVHWLLGLAVVALLLAHVALGRRSRPGSRSARHERVGHQPHESSDPERRGL